MSETTMQTLPKARAEKWEADESIVTIGGAIIGHTLRDADAARVARWLNEGGLKGIAATLSPSVEQHPDSARLDWLGAGNCVQSIPGGFIAWKGETNTEHHGTTARAAIDAAMQPATPSSESRP